MAGKAEVEINKFKIINVLFSEKKNVVNKFPMFSISQFSERKY